MIYVIFRMNHCVMSNGFDWTRTELWEKCLPLIWIFSVYEVLCRPRVHSSFISPFWMRWMPHRCCRPASAMEKTGQIPQRNLNIIQLFYQNISESRKKKSGLKDLFSTVLCQLTQIILPCFNFLLLKNPSAGFVIILLRTAVRLTDL